MSSVVLGSCSHSIETMGPPQGPHVYCPFCVEYVHLVQVMGPPARKVGGITLGGAITSIVLCCLYLCIALFALALAGILLKLFGSSSDGKGAVAMAWILGYVAGSIFGLVAGGLACTPRPQWALISGIVQSLFAVTFIWLAIDNDAVAALFGALLSLGSALMCFIGWSKDRARPAP